MVEMKKRRVDSKKRHIKTVVNHFKSSMQNTLDGTKLIRKTDKEYLSMTKKELITWINRLTGKYSCLSKRYVEVQLENNFLGRKINLLETKLEFYQKYYPSKEKAYNRASEVDYGS